MDATGRVAPHQLHVPAGAHVGDERGLTATGAVAVAVGAGLAGATIDVLTGSGLRTVFAVLFVLGCAIAAYKVHREDLLAAVVIPPLAYVALAFMAALGRASGVGGSFITQQILELFAALVLGAPALLTATGAAGAVAGLRWLALRGAGTSPARVPTGPQPG
ncbi:MAG TPA: DUF6542 domain-containing protein [Mycobacteriales bacterium]|nr:DUF6542 domain-containing protein [Mycobacteriales bacterium]